MKNILHKEPYFEEMALNAIVEKMMEDESNASITYYNDGSSMSGVGSYIVQSLTINGVQHSLPTLGVFTESRETLKDLEITTLKIISAASGHKYTKQDILCKIIHPLMMLQGKIKELCQEIHNALGNKKINECFLIDVEFKNESSVVKSLKVSFKFHQSGLFSKTMEQPFFQFYQTKRKPFTIS